MCVNVCHLISTEIIPRNAIVEKTDGISTPKWNPSSPEKLIKTWTPKAKGFANESVDLTTESCGHGYLVVKNG